PVPCQCHYAQVWKNVREIASSRSQQQHSHNQTAKCNWFDEVTSGVSKDRHPRIHPRYNRRMPRESAQEMFFGTMNFHRFYPAEHLVRFPEEATDRNS